MSKADFALSRRALLVELPRLGHSVLSCCFLKSGSRQGTRTQTQAPYFYRFKLGNAEATIVSIAVGTPITDGAPAVG